MPIADKAIKVLERFERAAKLKQNEGFELDAPLSAMSEKQQASYSRKLAENFEHHFRGANMQHGTGTQEELQHMVGWLESYKKLLDETNGFKTVLAVYVSPDLSFTEINAAEIILNAALQHQLPDQKQPPYAWRVEYNKKDSLFELKTNNPDMAINLTKAKEYINQDIRTQLKKPEAWAHDRQRRGYTIKSAHADQPGGNHAREEITRYEVAYSLIESEFNGDGGGRPWKGNPIYCDLYKENDEYRLLLKGEAAKHIISEQMGVEIPRIREQREPGRA